MAIILQNDRIWGSGMGLAMLAAAQQFCLQFAEISDLLQFLCVSSEWRVT